MDREQQPEPLPTPPVPVPVTGGTVLCPALFLTEWNMVLGQVAKGSIETHLDLFMKLKQSLEEQMKKASAP